MPDTHIVKARSHFGTASLDLTLPADLVRKYYIKKGDAFEVVAEISEKETIVRYRRIYSVK